MSVIGYARCSTDHQDTAAQVQALKDAGAERIYAENASGVVTDRPELRKALKALAHGDLLCVTKLDRLGRSLRDVLNTLQAITDKGAGFRVLDTPALDTTSPYGKLLLSVLGSLAEFERSLILSRTREGRARYVANGGKLGRKPTLTPYQIGEARQRRSQGESLTAIARSMGVAHSTVGRAVGGE